MTDSTNQMLTALSKLENSLANDPTEKKTDHPELNFNPTPGMANVLANCLAPDANDPVPQK